MDRIFEISSRLIKEVEMKHFRFLLDKIAWEDRLIFIKGARGVGKTTLLLQHIKQTFDPASENALYASLDNLWFNDHTIIDLADYHYKHGGTHLFLDEVHRYPSENWQQEIKNIYDSYPGYNIVFTGSSLLEIDNRIGDLSRRVVCYEMPGLSFREYLGFRDILDYKKVSLEEIISAHRPLANEITTDLKILPLFEEYMAKGYYPFFLHSSEFSYSQRVERIVSAVIDLDIPSIVNIEYETLQKMKRLLVILSSLAPFVPNIENLSKKLKVSRNQLIKLISLLSEGKIMRQLFDASKNPQNASKPAKLLFDNTSIMTGLGLSPDTGTARETFMVSMLADEHKVSIPKNGDFLVDGKILFEVGGKKKKFDQIKDIPDSYVAADQVEIGFGNKIPLWLFGFLY